VSADLQAILFASMASLCWAVAPLVAEDAVHKLGSFHFSRLVMAAAALGLALTALLNGAAWPDASAFGYLVASSFIGLIIGDLLIWHGLKALGPHRNSMLYALNVPFTVLMAFALLDERLNALQLVGVSAAFTGILCAIAFKSAVRAGDPVGHAAFGGILAALGGAVCQAGGAILAKPAFALGTEALSAAAVRVGVAALILNGIDLVARRRLVEPLDRDTTWRVLGSALLGPGLGLAFVMAGLSTGKAGLVSMFSSLSPLLLLPMLVYRGQRPRLLAWVGCGITMAGTVLILWRQ
jgi:drug/metabolite transporter (DMT)-like permease